MEPDKSHHTENRQNAPMEEQLFERLHYTAHFIRNHMGKRTGQGKILRYLRANGSMPQQELQNQLHLQSSSISEILPKLESAGFITRQKDAADKRCSIVTITEAGLEDLRLHQLSRQRRIKLLFSGLDASEREMLLHLLEKLHAGWEHIPPEAWEYSPAEPSGQEEAKQ